MSKRYSFIGLALIWSIVLPSAVLAQAPRTWTNTTTGTLRWTDATNWSPTGQPGTLDDARITNSFAANVIITDAVVTNVGNTATINFLATSNNTLNTTTIILTNSQLSVIAFGVQIGTNANVVVTTNAQFGITSSGLNNNFSLTAGGQKGTLTLSNANNLAAFTLFVIKGTSGGTTNAIVNGGTIAFNPVAASQTAGLNYGQTLSFTNLAAGTIIKTGAGTGTFVGTFGSNNRVFINEGTITVLAGTQRLEPRDAASAGGVRNAATGFIQVDTNAVLEIRRTVNAWTTSNVAPTNFGTFFLNGGEFRTFDSDTPATNSTRVVVNASGGIIRGNGLLDFTLRNETGGLIEAQDGTLSVVATFQNNGTWISTNFGGAPSVLNFTTGSADLGGGTLFNSNGTIRLTAGANLTLSTSYRQNSGTIDFAGAGNLLVANSASAAGWTNEFVIKKTASTTASITTGFGTGNQNFGFFNNGTIDLISSGRLAFNTSNAFSQTFMNLPGGTVAIGNVSTLRISRTSAAWNGGSAAPTNSGTITLNGGILETFDDGGLNTARPVHNYGTITGNGRINATITNGATGAIAPGLSIGTINLAGSLACASNSAIIVELGSLTGQNDLLAIAGNLTLDANSTLNITGGAVGNVYTVATFSARAGTFGSSTPNYSVTYAADSIAVEPLPDTHTITATAGVNGAIDPSGAVVVTNGNDQSFSITPDACYHVADVLVDTISVGAVTNYTFNNVTASHQIDASFAVDTYTITASAGTGGTIDPVGSVSVDCGSSPSFNIAPDTGYHIVDVLVDSESVGAVSEYGFTGVTNNHTIAASFAINTYTISASAGANGSIDPSGAVVVNHGDNQMFTITADACHHIEDVLVDGNSVGPVGDYTFTNVTAAATISASFAIDTYTITATAGINGSITPSGLVAVDCGTNQEFAITADTGHPVLDVLVDALSVGPVSSYTFTNVTSTHTIDASFATEMLRVLSITRQGSDMNLAWPVAGGHSYTVQSTAGAGGAYSNNFIDRITIDIPGIGESTTNYLDSGAATNVPALYYRIRLEP